MMDKNVIQNLREGLKKNFKNKQSAIALLESIKEVSRKSSTYSREEVMKRYKVIILAARPKRGTKHPNFITLQETIYFLSDCDPREAIEIASELLKIEINSNEYLYSKATQLFHEDIYEDIYAEAKGEVTFISVFDNTFFKKDCATQLLRSLFNLSVNRIGLEKSIKLLNGLMGLYLRENFGSSSKSAPELYVDSILYCEKNPDYPIDWVIETTFM